MMDAAAICQYLSEQIKKQVMQNMLQGYFAHTPHPICIDKNRFWCGFAHNFNHVEQVTQEDDTVYGFKDLHQIRNKVEPQGHKWNTVYDNHVFNTPAWKSIENMAQFWKAY